MRIRSRNLTKEQRKETLDALFAAAGSVQSRKAMQSFLENLLSESEQIMFGRRILIARSLMSGQTYDAIIEEFGVGKDTIRKVDQWLVDQFPEYEDIVRDAKTETKEKSHSDNFDPELYATSALYRLKKKYPMHFLFFPMPKSKKKR